LCALAGLAVAQPVQQVTVTGHVQPPLSVGGFGDTPLARLPMSGSVTSEAQLKDAGTRSLADLTQLDASINDAYNAEGYWGIVSIRGFTLDNRSNYRRDGLPINAETAIALDNKASIEVLKGTSGVQTGISAPGGLVNFVIKRPDATFRRATLGWRESGALAASMDVSQRFGKQDAFGLRINAAAEHIDPLTRDLEGHRHLLAIASDWRLGNDTVVEAELETTRQSQPSLPGFSLLGSTVPNAQAIDPRINLNNQPWTLPVRFEGHTASLRAIQRLGDWRLAAHAMTQRLRTDDRVAFPFGCSAEGNFDRYCSDGTFDLYDYRSDNERRRTDALDVSLSGQATWGGFEHRLALGALHTRFKARFQGLAFNFVGTGNIDGSATTAPDPTLGPGIANRDEKSTELYVRDTVRFDDRFNGWFGLRHTQLDRGYRQSFTTPWLALGYSYTTDHMVYASWGQGVETSVTPALYTNAGMPLPAQRSRQLEAGLKGQPTAQLKWSVAAFDIERPYLRDAFPDFFIDGHQRHRGLEAQVDARSGHWQWQASAMALRARSPGGARPANVPAHNVKLMLARDVDALPGLTLQGWVLAEGHRTALPAASSPRIGGWARVDFAARYMQRVGDATLTWRIGVDNAADKRAWKESPFQFAHAYLYPMAPRTWRVSLQADL
jgi:iron complex outermembrane recepter protein